MLVISDDRIGSDATTHAADRITDLEWKLSWLGTTVNEMQALTGMLLVDELATATPAPASTTWIWLDRWAADLGVATQTAVDAVRAEQRDSDGTADATPAGPRPRPLLHRLIRCWT